MIQLALVSPNNEEFDALLEDVNSRLMESQGETLYEIGTAGGQNRLRLYFFHDSDLETSMYF